MTYSIRYVQIGKFAELTGYTDKAIRRKIESGASVFFEKAPDKKILIDLRGYELWVRGNNTEGCVQYRTQP